ATFPPGYGHAKLWLEEHSSEFGVLPFPPELNVIEHIWDAKQRAVEHRNLTPRNTTELWTALQEVWCSLPTDYFRKLMEPKPRHISAVSGTSVYFLHSTAVVSTVGA
uniref:Tc1-like transposase DDE domain-containing protein n=1 Tax=Esox lucius TaxID=8010 RepID=A0AAY5LC80_ESOLU